MFEIMSDKPKHFGTDTGHVFGNIAILNYLSSRELSRELGISKDELYELIGVLLKDKSIYIWKNNTEYRPDTKLKQDWLDYLDSLSEEEKDELFWEGYELEIEEDLPWSRFMYSFCENNEITYTSDQGFFYLPDELLAIFQDLILTRPAKRMLIVNPFINYQLLKKKLIILRGKGTLIEIITRPPALDSQEYKIHTELSEKGIKIYYNDTIHAKMIILDDELALISSMNFIKQSVTPYNSPIRGSWESGVVITKPEILTEIKTSIAKIDRMSIEFYFA